MQRSKILALLTIGFAFLMFFSANALAGFPEKPITLMVPYSAGGPSDTISRIIADVATKYVDQPITVINRPGGSGTISVYELTKAKPDGYTMLFGSNSETASNLHRVKTNFGIEDYDVICRVGTMLVTLCSSKHNWKNLEEFVAWAKEKKGDFTAGVPGLGTIVRLTGERFAKDAGFKFKVVPFKGSGPVIPAVLGGHIDVAFLNVPEVSPQYQAGKMNVVAVFGDQRSNVLPDVPTAKEQGFNIVGGAVHSIVVPNGVPENIKKKLHEIISNVIKDQKFKDAVAKIGYTPMYADAATSKKFLKEWYDATGVLMKELGLAKK